MLDRESEIYNSGVLNQDARERFAAVVLTRDGIEIAAATQGFRFDYSNTWDRIRAGLASADARLKAQSLKLAEKREQRVAFAQKLPRRHEVSSETERN